MECSLVHSVHVCRNLAIASKARGFACMHVFLVILYSSIYKYNV